MGHEWADGPTPVMLDWLPDPDASAFGVGHRAHSHVRAKYVDDRRNALRGWHIGKTEMEPPASSRRRP